MVRDDENYGRHDRIGTEDLVAPGGTADRDTPDRLDSVRSRPLDEQSSRPDATARNTVQPEHAVPDARPAGNVRGDLADTRKPATVNGSANRQATPSERGDGHATLIEDSDSTRFRSRWHDVQAAFVDDPRRAVQDADQLVAELMQTLAATFADRKQALEGRWQKGHDAETEDLRLALRSYRSFFDQLLPH